MCRLLIRELYVIYGSLVEGRKPMLGKVYPYVNYIKWLSGLDRSAGGSYWQEYLGGYERVSGAPYRKGSRARWVRWGMRVEWRVSG